MDFHRRAQYFYRDLSSSCYDIGEQILLSALTTKLSFLSQMARGTVVRLNRSV